MVNFFGRSDYLEILEKRVSGLTCGYRQNIALLGDELVGKTSLIHKFLGSFCDNRIIPVYLEIKPESLASFARRFIGVLLYNFLLNSNQALEENLDFLIIKAASYIPRSTEKINAILADLERRKKENIFTQLLSLSEIVREETGKSCLLIFDEFHNLETFGIKKLYAEWTKILISQKNTMYIIASSAKSRAQSILSKELSLLFGNFEVVNVEPFDIRTSEEYLEYILPGPQIDRGIKNFIVHFTGGYPFYLWVIAEYLLRSKQNLVDILEKLLFSSSGILNQRFSNYLKTFQDKPCSQNYLSILYLISGGHNKVKEMAHLLHKPQKEVALRINQLLEWDALSRCGDFFRINDRVFSFWLKFVYEGKTHAFTFDSKNQRDVFRKNIEDMIEEFIRYSNKPVSERVMELLRLFQDDVIQLGKKKLRLGHFREIKSLEFSGRPLHEGLLCRSADGLWIMGFKYDFLSEEDISGFAQECRKYRHKRQKKIIVSLGGVDTNSRLRALEEKILTWDINGLNQLFDLFSKPRIIA